LALADSISAASLARLLGFSQGGRGLATEFEECKMSSLKLIVAIVIPVCTCLLTVGQDISFERIIVDDQGPQDPWAKILADIDGDGQLDVAIGGREGPLVWYRFPDWKKALVAVAGYDTVDGEAGDIDGDGDPDLILGGLYWYENPRSKSGFQDAWRVHQIAEHGTHDVELADLDGDGDLDVITRDQSAFSDPRGNEIHVWLQEAPDSWKHAMLSCIHGEGIRVADLDGDEDSDIIINGFWFENRGKPLDVQDWKKHKITNWHHSSSVAVGDVNRDDRNDVILVPSELQGESFTIAWYEAVNFATNHWIEHIIEPEVETVYHSLQVADMDGDGLLDIVTAQMHQGVNPDEVMIYLNQNGGESWDRRVISTKGSHGLQVADVDGDGRPDVMGANWSGPYQPIELWKNVSK
jgi:hypothetical protein